MEQYRCLKPNSGIILFIISIHKKYEIANMKESKISILKTFIRSGSLATA